MLCRARRLFVIWRPGAFRAQSQHFWTNEDEWKSRPFQHHRLALSSRSGTFRVDCTVAGSPSQRARWEAIARKLRDEDLLVKDMRDGVLGARVVNIPANLLADANGVVAHDTIVAINDHVAGSLPVTRGKCTAWHRSMPTTATGRPAKPNVQSAISGCAVCSSTVRAAIS